MFRWVTDVERGDWIAGRLGPFGGWVGSVVPGGFDAYARVLHRASDRDAVPVRWAQVAASSGTEVHPTAQWWKVARRPDGLMQQQPTVAHDEPWPDGRWAEGARGTRRGKPREWPGANPAVGELDPEQLAALAHVLRDFSGAREVTAGFWEGSGWQGAVWLTSVREGWDGARAGVPTGGFLDRAVLEGPTLELPGRRHFLFVCTLDDLAGLAGGTAVADVTPFSPGRRTPSLVWPDDRGWCVATEVDFDSTLVGGPRPLIDAVLADETLEALELSEADSLMVDGDRINPWISGLSAHARPALGLSSRVYAWLTHSGRTRGR